MKYQTVLNLRAPYQTKRPFYFFSLHLCLLFVLIVPSLLQAEESTHSVKPSQLIYFALANQHNAPLKESKESFACSDKIFTVIELKNYPAKKYKLSVRWYDPANKLRENTQYPFTVSNKETRLWAWLRLSRGAGAGMWQWINPAAGLEDFIGPWKAEVYINDKKIESKEFSVDC